ncbi:MAG: fasciclin domain-containing protein [bacterium]|nr:fasciclin domain-containing protein [bacterium]
MRMKLWLLCGFLVTIFTGSVSAISTAQWVQGTLTEHIASADDLRIFGQLLSAADPAIREWLDDETNRMSVFAPSDAAWETYFADLGITPDDLITEPRRLNDLLRRHIVPMILLPMLDMVIDCREVGTMLPNERLILDWNLERDQFIVNIESNAATFDLLAVNGQLFILDRVLTPINLIDSAGDHTPENVPTLPPPPTPSAVPIPQVDSLASTIGADERFTTLMDYLRAAEGYWNLLKSDGLYMLFAPTNTAIKHYLDETEVIPADFAEQLVASNLVPGYFTPDVFFEVYRSAHGSYCSPQIGGSFKINQEDDMIVIGDQAQLTGEVFLAGNVIVYVIDGVHLSTPITFQG